MYLIDQLAIIWGLVFLGFICGRKKIFRNSYIESFEIYLFKIALPCSLFNVAIDKNFFNILDIWYIYSYIISFSIIALIAALYFWKQNSLPALCIKILSAGYVNAAIYTLPIISFLLKDPKAGVIGNIIQVIIIQSFVVTILSVCKDHGNSLFRKLITPLTTPLIIMPIIAVSLNYLQIEPNIIMSMIISNLSNGAFSLALFTFGLNLSTIKLNWKIINKDLLFIVFAKNLLHPIVAFSVGKYIFVLDDYWLYSLIIAASAPTAFMVYLIAKRYSTEEDIAKLSVSITSILSILSLSLITFFIMYK